MNTISLAGGFRVMGAPMLKNRKRHFCIAVAKTRNPNFICNFIVSHNETHKQFHFETQ